MANQSSERRGCLDRCLAQTRRARPTMTMKKQTTSEAIMLGCRLSLAWVSKYAISAGVGTEAMTSERKEDDNWY